MLNIYAHSKFIAYDMYLYRFLQLGVLARRVNEQDCNGADIALQLGVVSYKVYKESKPLYAKNSYLLFPHNARNFNHLQIKIISGDRSFFGLTLNLAVRLILTDSVNLSIEN